MNEDKTRAIAPTEWEAQWLEWFGLRRRAFVAVPSPEHYCPLEPIESGRQNLVRMIRRGEGAGLVAGPPGTGKTLLCHLLARELAGDFAVVLLSGGRIDTPRALYQAILFQLGLNFFGLDEGELRIVLEAYLQAGELPEFVTKSPRAKLPPRPVVLLVDEAHSLPLRILEDIRTLTNVIQEEYPRGHVVLSGGMLLEDRLSSPRLEAFAQRVVVRVYLQAFNRPQTEAFLRHQLALAGGDPDKIFSPDAVDAVYRASGGIPRLVNQLADHAMFLAFAQGKKQVNWQLVEEAWSDLQQLPGPWNDSQRRTERPSIIEFGHLSEDRDEAAEHGSRVLPFLRVTGPDRAPEQSVLDNLEELEQAVQSLADVAGDKPPSDTSRNRGAAEATAAACPSSDEQRVASVNAETIVVELPPSPNPFTDIFETEQVVDPWHVNYFCRQHMWTFADLLRSGGIFGEGWHSRAAWWARCGAEDNDEFVFPPGPSELYPGVPFWSFSTVDSFFRNRCGFSLTNASLRRDKQQAEPSPWIIEIPLLAVPAEESSAAFGEKSEGPGRTAELSPWQTQVLATAAMMEGDFPGELTASGNQSFEGKSDVVPVFPIPWCEESQQDQSMGLPPQPVRRVSGVQSPGRLRRQISLCNTRAEQRA